MLALLIDITMYPALLINCAKMSVTASLYYIVVVQETEMDWVSIFCSRTQ